MSPPRERVSVSLIPQMITACLLCDSGSARCEACTNERNIFTPLEGLEAAEGVVRESCNETWEKSIMSLFSFHMDSEENTEGSPTRSVRPGRRSPGEVTF